MDIYVALRSIYRADLLYRDVRPKTEKKLKKRLTDGEFASCVKDLAVGRQTINIARGVLVDGLLQSAYVVALGLSKGAVSQAVHRVWSIFESNLPDGYERVSMVLPYYQAFIVQRWAKAAVKKRGQKL